MWGLFGLIYAVSHFLSVSPEDWALAATMEPSTQCTLNTVSLLFLGRDEPSLSLCLSAHLPSCKPTRLSPWMTLFSKLQFSRNNAKWYYYLSFDVHGLCSKTKYCIWQQIFIEHLLHAKHHVRVWSLGYELFCIPDVHLDNLQYLAQQLALKWQLLLKLRVSRAWLWWKTLPKDFFKVIKYPNFCLP